MLARSYGQLATVKWQGCSEGALVPRFGSPVSSLGFMCWWADEWWRMLCYEPYTLQPYSPTTLCYTPIRRQSVERSVAGAWGRQF